MHKFRMLAGKKKILFIFKTTIRWLPDKSQASGEGQCPCFCPPKRCVGREHGHYKLHRALPEVINFGKLQITITSGFAGIN